jgi:2-polyprenyl-3-methyl-5-hydroxy-6-metoxy-1,4-benzoquinol methylase
MLPFIPSSARHFLELGCGIGAFGALLRDTIEGAHVIGIESHQTASQEARSRIDVVVERPIDEALGSIPPQSIDCVICNDILEHLVDPWETLGQLKQVLRPNGCVVASIPNVRHFPVFKSYFLGADWKYEKWGVLDSTHLRFFTAKSIERMFCESGYVPLVVQGIFEQRLTWKMAALNLVLRGRLDDMKYERFACVARPS